MASLYRLGPTSAVLASIALLAFAVTSARADDWTNMSASMFPSKVQSVTFSNGDVIDATHSECWGKWCVQLDSAAPTIAQHANNNGIVLISISPLVCHNDIVGNITGTADGNACRMDMIMKQGSATCGLAIFKNSNNYGFDIQCPTDLKLQ